MRSSCSGSRAGSKPGSPTIDARLTVAQGPVRLDRFLTEAGPFAGLGRRRIAELVAAGRVRVNGTRARKGVVVAAGDVVTIAFDAAARGSASATTPRSDTAIPLSVVYVDDALVAVDKPPGLATTAGRTPGPSLAAALIARFPEMATFGDPRHAGLAHRLDTGTSGILLAARDRETHARLRAAFRRKAVMKDYLAVVVGRMPEPRRVTQSLARRHRGGGRMIAATAATRRAWPAATEVLPIGGDDAFSVVRLRMRTGVTHQLRVHLAGLGHPIVGDRRYGAAALHGTRLGVPMPAWHFLHARRIRFDDLPWVIATPFPAHWRALFAARGWTLPAGDDD